MIPEHRDDEGQGDRLVGAGSADASTLARDANDLDESPVPLRRVTLETAHAFFSSDYAVVATWIDEDLLHVATCDYGDRTDKMAWGEDIPEGLELFAWMITDRFGTDRQRLHEYAEQNGSACAPEPNMEISEATPDGLTFTLDEDGSALALFNVWSDPKEVYRFGDWRSLLLYLLVDRCEGVNARDRVTSILESAGVASIERDRGYVFSAAQSRFRMTVGVGGYDPTVSCNSRRCLYRTCQSAGRIPGLHTSSQAG